MSAPPRRSRQGGAHQPRARAREIPLRQLQAWFQNEILGAEVLPRRRRGSPESKSRKTRALVLPSPTLSPGKRVEIYARSYFSRLHDCLLDDFPAIHRLIGDGPFYRLARLYLGRFPSAHYSLNQLGERLPRFLEGRVPVPRRKLLGDIARVELSMSRVFDAEESRPLRFEDLPPLSPERLGRARLRFIPAFELLELDHPVNALVTAARREKPVAPPPKAPAWVAVWRRNYQVFRQDLDRTRYTLLKSLAAGKTVLEALRAAAKVWPGRPEALGGEIFHWFREWVTEGMIRAVDLGKKSRKSERVP